MKKFLFVLIIIVEGVFGLLFCCGAINGLLKGLIMVFANVAYGLGELVGALIAGMLGFYLIRHAFRTAQRMKGLPEAR